MSENTSSLVDLRMGCFQHTSYRHRLWAQCLEAVGETSLSSHSVSLLQCPRPSWASGGHCLAVLVPEEISELLHHALPCRDFTRDGSL